MLLTGPSLESLCSNLPACLLGLVHNCHTGSASITDFVEISCAFARVLDPSLQPAASPVYLTSFSWFISSFRWEACSSGLLREGSRVVKFLRPCVCGSFSCPFLLDDYWTVYGILNWTSFFFRILKALPHCHPAFGFFLQSLKAF